MTGLRELTVCRPVELVLDMRWMIQPGEIPEVPLSEDAFLYGNAERIFRRYTDMGGSVQTMILHTGSLPPLRASRRSGMWRGCEQTLRIERATLPDRHNSLEAIADVEVLELQEIDREIAEGSFPEEVTAALQRRESRIKTALFGARWVPRKAWDCSL